MGRASQAEERTTAQTCWEDATNADEVTLTNIKKGATQTQSTWAPTHMAPSSEPSLDIFLRTMALTRQLVTEERHGHLDAFIAPICVFVERGYMGKSGHYGHRWLSNKEDLDKRWHNEAATNGCL